MCFCLMDSIILCKESLESLSACWMGHGYLCAVFFIWLEFMVCCFLQLTMTEGGFQDGLFIEMIALGAVETSLVGILAEAGAMGEMTFRGEVISQIKLVVMLDGMKKLATGSTKMEDGKATHQANQGSMS